ncbi:Ig-like domain-containing protein, partial [Pectobacterium brasiliense]|uniref:Ig-like domain-containing protein n=1 Tax=Pectobacterium brasiliense TaxID=180957 RepID=UPI0019698BF8
VSLKPNATTAIADNFASIEFTATVRDTLGNLVPNVDVGFTNNGGTLNEPKVSTNANGEATVSLTSATIGNVMVTAKVNNNAADTGQSATVAFTADVTTAIVTNIGPQNATVAVDFNTIIVTATVKDTSGHPVPNADVAFTTTLGNISPQTATTDANGKASAFLNSNTVGDAIVTAKVSSNANDTGKSTTVFFVEEIVRAIANPEQYPKTTLGDNLIPAMFTAVVQNRCRYPVSSTNANFATIYSTLSQKSDTNSAGRQASISLAA